MTHLEGFPLYEHCKSSKKIADWVRGRMWAVTAEDGEGKGGARDGRGWGGH